ncbi:hypothetical protein P8452_56230 [Trifolium repens]|nr:hypothetical protein P8452_56230 [Trifolium repens]
MFVKFELVKTFGVTNQDVKKKERAKLASANPQINLPLDELSKHVTNTGTRNRSTSHSSRDSLCLNLALDELSPLLVSYFQL